ncbi:MAG: class I SAM-dependent methyltransferase [Sulfurifustaceae bacterium]
MTLAVDSSYQLGTFRDNEDSLRRLKTQAGIVLDIEFEHMAQAGLRRQARVMDLGCGPGIIATQIAKRANPRRLVAADCNDISLAETRRQLSAAGVVDAEVMNLNVYDPDLARAAGEFDFICSRLLFQHLSDPLNALVNIRGCLAEQGRFCICDIDDRWLGMAPEVKEFRSFLQRVASAQAERGGDRHVGSKLAHYLKRAGYADIRSSMLLLTTDLIGKDAFCDLIFGYKLEVVRAAEVEIARDEMRAIKNGIFTEDGWAGVGVFFVSAQNDTKETKHER